MEKAKVLQGQFIEYTRQYTMRYASYTTKELPENLKKQLLTLYRKFFPDGFTGKNEDRDWLDKFSIPTMRFLILDIDKIVSHAAIITKFIEHGIGYKLAGLGGVLTVEEYRGKGYGTEIVKLATEYIDTKDFDIAVLFCEPKNQKFYERNGWQPLLNPNITVGEYGVHEYPQKNVTMIRFISEKAKKNKDTFVDKPIFFGNEW